LLYRSPERAALDWTEALTRLSEAHSKKALSGLKAQFTEEEQVKLTLMIMSSMVEPDPRLASACF